MDLEPPWPDIIGCFTNHSFASIERPLCVLRPLVCGLDLDGLDITITGFRYPNLNKIRTLVWIAQACILFLPVRIFAIRVYTGEGHATQNYFAIGRCSQRKVPPASTGRISSRQGGVYRLFGLVDQFQDILLLAGQEGRPIPRMDPVQVNPSAPNFNAWPQQNGVSAHQGRHPSSGLNSHGNEAQDCYHFEADPRFGHGSYPFSQCGLTDNYSLGYTTFATHFTQGSEIPRHYPVNNNERHASGDLHYGNRLERLPNVPQDAAVQEIWAHGDVRSNPPWSRPTSMGITHHVLMELDPVVADEQLVHGHPFSFRQGIAQLPPESATTRSVFPHHPSQDPDFLPQKTVTEDRHLLSYPWQDPVKPLHSEPMRRGSKVLPIHVRYGLHGGLETQPRRRNTWSRNIPGDYVSTSMGPNTGPRPEELLYNHWSRPASLMWVPSDGHTRRSNIW